MDNKRLSKILKKYGDQTVAKMIVALNSGGKGDSRFIKKLKCYVEESDDILQLFIEMPSYGTFIDKGRGPNKKMPPEKPIVDWMQRKSIKGSSYGIRKKISIRGIKPVPFLDIWFKEVLKINDVLIDVTKDTIKQVMRDIKNKIEVSIKFFMVYLFKVKNIYLKQQT